MSMSENQHVMMETMQTGQGEGQDNVIICNNGKKLTICPMCGGKGVYEEISPPEFTTKDKSCLLPAINSQQNNQTYNVEQLFKVEDVKQLRSRLSDSAVPNTIVKPNTRLPPVHIPNMTRKSFSTTGHVKSSPNNATFDNFPQLVNLLPAPTKLDKHPEDVARLAAIKLNRNEWEVKKGGLEECIQLCHYHPDELEPYMSLVYRTLSSLLNNCRPNIVLFVCQAAREFFAHMRSVCRPEYDELVFSLLNRTADNNRYIRLNANDALDKMVTYIPTVHAVRPLVEKGPTHNNPLVRTATARLLTCVVALKTPNVILSHPNLRETCKKILDTVALLLGDGNLDTRATAKKLLHRFMSEDDFESIYYAEVDEALRKRAERAFIELKYKRQQQE